jgi:hypothetical protein
VRLRFANKIEEDDIKIELIGPDVEVECVDLIKLYQDRVQWRDLMKQ